MTLTFRARAMMDIARDAATCTAEQLFERLVNQVAEQLHYYHAHLYLREGDSMVLAYGYGEAGAQMLHQKHRLPLQKGLVGAAARSGEPVLAADVSEHPDWAPNPLLPHTCCELAVPIKLGNKVLGVLDVQSDQVGGLTMEDQELLLGLCGIVAVVIENSRLVAQMRKQIEEQSHLADIVRELSSPVIQVWPGILVLPLVGTIDSSRAGRIMEDMLTGITRFQAEQVIIDVTGVPVFDSGVANHLMQTISAARLLGATCMLVGINSEMAQTIVELGVDLSAIVTHSSLQTGLQSGLGRLGYAIQQRRSA